MRGGVHTLARTLVLSGAVRGLMSAPALTRVATTTDDAAFSDKIEDAITNAKLPSADGVTREKIRSFYCAPARAS